MSSLASFVVVFISRTFGTHVAAQGTPTGYEIREKQDFSHLFEGACLNQREIWFPTLSKTVWILSQLHDFVQVRFSEFFSCNAPVLSAGNSASCLQRPRP